MNGFRFHGIVALDGLRLFDTSITFTENVTPDVATLHLVKVAEEQLDRRILGEAHQMEGRTVNIAVKPV